MQILVAAKTFDLCGETTRHIIEGQPLDDLIPNDATRDILLGQKLAKWQDVTPPVPAGAPLPEAIQRHRPERQNPKGAK